MQELNLSSLITLNGVRVGPGEPAFIIAEIGVNHNGDLSLAKEMIDAAQDCGASCVKFQSFRTEEFMGSDVIYEYMSNGKLVAESMVEMFKRLELPMEWHRELFEYANSKGVVPMTSVADRIIAQEVFELPADGIKLASEDLINIDLVDYVVSQKRPIIFSTGMADQEEVQDVVDILKKYDHRDVAFLHCVSVYPTPFGEANLRRMLQLRNFLGGGIVGYSDHTEGIDASVAAVAMGANIIEKHFTLDKNLEGPDHSLSSDVDEFRELIHKIRQIEEMLGSSEIAPSLTELSETRPKFRRSIVANRDINAGERIQLSDLAYRRPGKGLRPREREVIIGKTLKKLVKRNEVILQEDVE